MMVFDVFLCFFWWFSGKIPLAPFVGTERRGKCQKIILFRGRQPRKSKIFMKNANFFKNPLQSNKAPCPEVFPQKIFFRPDRPLVLVVGFAQGPEEKNSRMTIPQHPQKNMKKATFSQKRLYGSHRFNPVKVYQPAGSVC